MSVVASSARRVRVVTALKSFHIFPPLRSMPVGQREYGKRGALEVEISAGGTLQRLHIPEVHRNPAVTLAHRTVATLLLKVRGACSRTFCRLQQTFLHTSSNHSAISRAFFERSGSQRIPPSTLLQSRRCPNSPRKPAPARSNFFSLTSTASSQTASSLSFLLPRDRSRLFWSSLPNTQDRADSASTASP